MTSVLPPLAQAVSGGLGSVVANTGSYPLDVIATRLQTQRTSGDPKAKKLKPLDVVKDIVRRNGWSGFYAGFASDSLATLISNFIYFYAYSFIRGKLLIRKEEIALRLEKLPSPTPFPYPPKDRLPVILGIREELGAGFVAGVISRLASTPLSIITVRLQVEQEKAEGEDSIEEKPGIASVVKRLYNEEGLFGFWKGFQSTILLCSNPAITLFLYQSFRRVFLRGANKAIPTPRQAFVGAALSNAIAITLLYPLILIKARLQSARSNKGPATIMAVIDDVIGHKGISGLYDGLQVQLLKGVLSQGLTMMIKQRIEALIVTLYLMSRQKSVAQ
ncbi:hypothetical protein FRC01_012353 [Tulasnella sp. 417]|nr:hypothetical protein FRC01_012353 [Tulasnella sp. 417]